MRKSICLLLLLLLAFQVVGLQAQERSTVTWWATERGRDTAATRELHFQLARAFEAANPDVQVAVSLFPSRGFATRILTAIAAGQGPDIWYHYFSAEVAEQGFMEDLTERVEAAGIADDWFPAAQRRVLHDGRYTGVPRGVGVALVYYNKDLFDAAGVAYPQAGWTVSDFREVAAQLTSADENRYGAGGIVGGDGCMLWSPFSFNLGAEITSPDGRQVLGYMDTPETAAAYQWCLEMVTEGLTSPPAMGEQFGENTFLSGQVALQSLSNWELLEMQEKADFNWGVVEAPRLDADSPLIPWTDSYVYNMWSGSQNKDAAWRLLEFLVGPEAQRMAHEANVWPSILPSVWEELGKDSDELEGVAYQQLLQSDRVPNYLRSQFFWDCVYGPFADVRTLWIESGLRDIGGALADGAQTAQACLDENYAAMS